MKLSHYLSSLKFDPSLKKGLVASYLTNFRFVSLFLVTILGLGIFSFTSLPRRLNPEVNIPYVGVSAVLPGASPTDVESLLTIPLEDELNGIEGLTRMTSSSLEGRSSITLEFEMGVDPDEKKQEVQSAVDAVGDLPEDVIGPNVGAADIDDEPVWKFALVADDPVTLYRFAGELEERLEALGQVKKVDLYGRENQEIQVVVEAEKVNSLGINPMSLSAALKEAVGAMPVGSVRENGSDIVVSVEASIESMEELYALPVKVDGKIVSLADIASVYRRSKPGSAASFIASDEFEAQAAVTLGVYRSQAAEILETVDEARAVVEAESSKYPSVKSVDITDSAKDIRVQFDDLYGNFGFTVLLVFVVLFLFLGIKQALIVSLSIPLTFLSAFFVMKTAGITLNFLSVFSLLLALGMLVDDAIVIVEAMSRYYKTGKFDGDEAGLLVWRDFIVPIWSTTLTTVWAFVPLFLSTGITGEFIRSIPIVVSAALISSTMIAVLVTLPLMMRLMKLEVAWRVKILSLVLLFVALVAGFVYLVPKSSLLLIEVVVFVAFVGLSFRLRKEIAKRINWKRLLTYTHLLQGGLLNLDGLTARYKKMLGKIIVSSYWRKRVVWMVVIFSLFSYLLLPLGLVKNEFFPKTDMDQIYIGLELPSGTAVRTTENEVERILNRVRNVDGLEYVTGEVGYKIGMGFGSSSGSNMATVTLKLAPGEERKSSSIVIAANLREEFADYDMGRLDVIEVTGGPPAGAEVQIRLLGDELVVLDEKADQLVFYLEEQPGVINVETSAKAGVSRLGFEADQVELSQAGVSMSTLGVWFRSFLSGFELIEAQFNGDKEKVMFYFDRDLLAVEELDRLMVPGAGGVDVPLASLGEFRLRANPEKIEREDGKRIVTVSAALEEGYNATLVNQSLIEYANSLDLPSGYEWRTGGANEENQESVNSIIQGMLVAVVLILITMVLQLGSYRKALIVLLVIPLAVSGVFIIFGLTGTPLSFPSLIGVLALFGIVVNNSIMVVERINQNVKQKISFEQAVVEASAGRLEPIAFSSLTTILGLIPISISDPLWRGLGGAIIAGLTFSGTIMLFFIPVVYYSWFKK